MKMQTIKPATLAELAEAGGNFCVSVHVQSDGWTVYVHDETHDYSLLDIEGAEVALFDSLMTVEQRLRELGVVQFDIDGRIDRDAEDAAYSVWVREQVQEALDDPSPLIPHDEAIRQIKAALKAG